MKMNLDGYKPTGNNTAYHPKHGAANLSDEEYASLKKSSKNHESKAVEKKRDIAKKTIPAHYRGNTNSEGGIPFGKAPKGER